MSSEIPLPNAFVMLYTMAVEDLLVSAAAKKEIELYQHKGVPELADYLQERGVITPVVVEFARDVWELRNKVVHDPELRITREEMQQRLANFKRLAADYGWHTHRNAVARTKLTNTF